MLVLANKFGNRSDDHVGVWSQAMAIRAGLLRAALEPPSCSVSRLAGLIVQGNFARSANCHVGSLTLSKKNFSGAHVPFSKDFVAFIRSQELQEHGLMSHNLCVEHGARTGFIPNHACLPLAIDPDSADRCRVQTNPLLARAAAGRSAVKS